MRAACTCSHSSRSMIAGCARSLRCDQHGRHRDRPRWRAAGESWSATSASGGRSPTRRPRRHAGGTPDEPRGLRLVDLEPPVRTLAVAVGSAAVGDTAADGTLASLAPPLAASVELLLGQTQHEPEHRLRHRLSGVEVGRDETPARVDDAMGGEDAIDERARKPRDLPHDDSLGLARLDALDEPLKLAIHDALAARDVQILDDGRPRPRRPSASRGGRSCRAGRRGR